MTGDYDYVVRVVVVDTADFERLHSKHLARRLPGVARAPRAFVAHDPEVARAADSLIRSVAHHPGGGGLRTTVTANRYCFHQHPDLLACLRFDAADAARVTRESTVGPPMST